MTQRIASRDGKLSVECQQKISVRTTVEQIFNNLDEIEIRPDHP
jgi:hypothetical protein